MTGIPPSVGELGLAAWEECTPFLAHYVKVRRVLLSTNAIESLNARHRRSAGARGHFPSEQAALTGLTVRGLDLMGSGRHDGSPGEAGGQRVRLTFADRMPAAENP